MVALSLDQRFAKVLDYHSSGREVLWGYSCLSHPLAGFLQAEAVELSTASGYGGDERPPSAEGEEYEWPLAMLGSHAFLIETALQFQPSFAEAQAEADQVWTGLLWMLQRPISVSGHVRDACTNLPLAGTVTVRGLAWSNGETNPTGGAFNRYQLFLPPGGYDLEFSAPGYAKAFHSVSVTATSAESLDVALAPLAPAGCWSDLGSAKPGSNGLPELIGFGVPAPGQANELRLGSAAPLAVTHLVVGLQVLQAPFKGGVLVPRPDLILTLGTDADGALVLPFSLPALLPPGTLLVFQHWIEDPGASAGLSASNGEAAVTG